MNLHDNVLRLECDLLHFSIFFWRLALNWHSAIHRGHVQLHKDVIPKCKLDKTYHLVLNQFDFLNLRRCCGVVYLTASILPGCMIGPQTVGALEGKKSDSGEGTTFLLVFIKGFHFVAHQETLSCFARHVRPGACGRGTNACLDNDLPWVSTLFWANYSDFTVTA